MSWLTNVRDNWLQLFTNLLLALCIITLPAYTDTGKNAFYLLALLSLYYLFRNLHQLKQLDRILKIFFVVIVLHFLWTLLTFYINGSPGRGNNFIWSRQVFLLFIPSLYLLFRAVKIPFYMIWPAVLLSVVLAAYVGYQDIQVGNGRAQGGMHPILFGSILLCEAFYLLVIAALNKQPWVRIISLLGFALATLVVIWTKSRGVWAAYPVLLLVFVLVMLNKYPLKFRIMGAGFLLCLLALSLLHPVVKQRVDMTQKNIQMYMTETDVNNWKMRTSIGTRFQMWKAGWQIFVENPLTGVGLGGYDMAAREGSDRYGVGPSAFWFYHPHNQYISALSTRGFAGFILLLAMLVMPFWYAVRRSSYAKDRKSAAIIIYLSCLAYMIFGLSDVPLEGKATIIFYVVFITWLLSEFDRDSSKERLEERAE